MKKLAAGRNPPPAVPAISIAGLSSYTGDAFAQIPVEGQYFMATLSPFRVIRGPNVDNPGPLTQKVLAYADTMTRLVLTAKTENDWAPLAEFVQVDGFERIGTFLEVQNWQDYMAMVAQWASTISTFETTVHRIAELPNLVYFEIEERHFYPGAPVHVVNSLTVFEFNDAGKISHLDVFLQQGR